MHGFLGTRASFMLDVVFLAMFAVVPILLYAVSLARRRHNYALHKRIQASLSLVLLAAVTLFEIDMRFFYVWEREAQKSPYFASGLVTGVLWVHLFFAVTTAVLWSVVVVRALRNFPAPPVPGAHSTWHRRWGWIAAIDMLLTSFTGWTFYWLAFAAT